MAFEADCGVSTVLETLWVTNYSLVPCAGRLTSRSSSL
jgi:hypothetical protein